MAEVSICIQSSWTVPRCLFPVSLSESSTLVLSADNLPALLELLFYAMNLLSHLATCWVVSMPLTENVVSGCLQKTFAMESGCICTCVVACDWWPHRHHPPTMLHIFHPPLLKEKERGSGRPPIGLVLGSRLGCPWQSLEVRCFVDGFLMTPVWLQAHCTALTGRWGKLMG